MMTAILTTTLAVGINKVLPVVAMNGFVVPYRSSRITFSPPIANTVPMANISDQPTLTQEVDQVA
jgi:hypothetical protein